MKRIAKKGLKSLKCVSTIIILHLLSSSLFAYQFDFGFSTKITVPVNQEVELSAAIINRDSIPLDFGCLNPSCGGLSLSFGASAGPEEGLNALNLKFGSALTQFDGVVLEENERFDFTFGTIKFDTLNYIGNPHGHALHPYFNFRIFGTPPAIAYTDTVQIIAGSELSISPLTFFQSTPNFLPPPGSTAPVPIPERSPDIPVIPEPATVILVATGLLGVGLLKKKRV